MDYWGSVLQTLVEVGKFGDGHFILFAANISGFCYLIGAYCGFSEDSDAVSDDILCPFLHVLRGFKIKYRFGGSIIAGDWNFVIGDSLVVECPLLNSQC